MLGERSLGALAIGFTSAPSGELDRELFLSTRSEAFAAERPAASTEASLSVLIIEDDRDAGEMTCLLVEELGHQVALAQDGRRGLTAAHCISERGRLIEHAVRIAPEVGRERLISVVSKHRHPDFDPETLAADVAVLELGERVEIDPVELTFDASIEAGTDVRVVGFGFTEEENSGVLGERRSRVVEIEEPGDPRIRLSSSTCLGDSGGPVLLDVGGREMVLAIVTSGPAGCRFYGTATRVAGYRAWLESELEASVRGGCTHVRTRSDSSWWAPILFFILMLCRARRTDVTRR